MKNIRSSFLFISLIVFGGTQSVSAQKKIAELTITYDNIIVSGREKKVQGSDASVNTVYIKGNLSRSEISNTQYSSTTIFDGNTNSGVILKEVSGQKLLIKISAENWEEMNRPYEGILFTKTADTRVIAGYKCVMATGKAKDGTMYTVYYTPDISPENKSYNAKFKNLDGLPLEYELSNGNLTIKYVVSKINLNPVPASKFDIPKTGYRELSYDQSKKIKNGK